ncbi:MAG TPA: methyltransferase domain-containing protein [Polyangiales bacterium]|nr:methyltransferase domain-containing protein [Polyangiales bacterium]
MSTAGYRFANLLTLPGSPHRFIAAQLRQPSGRFGRWVMTRVLNNRNAELITSTVDALQLRRDQSFLDLGFGGGLGLQLAAARTDAPLWGVDFSADVVLAGVDAFADVIAAGRLNLVRADVADLPLRDGLVEAIATVNTIYFWPDVLRGLSSLLRVLRPGGRIAIGYSGATKMRDFGKITQHGFRTYEPAEVEALLRDAGFTRVSTQTLSGKTSRGDYVSLGVREVGAA